MRRILVPIVAILFYSSILNAQEKPRSNALSLELGKTGFVWNLSYDHQFPGRFGLRAAGGSSIDLQMKVKNAGGGLYYLAGKTKRHLEAGIDLYYLDAYNPPDDDNVVVYPGFNYFDETTEGLYSSINLGYRSYGSKSMFRIGVSPGLMKGDFVPGGYISFGVRF